MTPAIKYPTLEVKRSLISEDLVNKIYKDFSNHIADFPSLGVDDYMFDESKVKVFVEFASGSWKYYLSVKSIEIIDSDYEPIKTSLALEVEKDINDLVKEFNEKHSPLNH